MAFSLLRVRQGDPLTSLFERRAAAVCHRTRAYIAEFYNILRRWLPLHDMCLTHQHQASPASLFFSCPASAYTYLKANNTDSSVHKYVRIRCRTGCVDLVQHARLDDDGLVSNSAQKFDHLFGDLHDRNAEYRANNLEVSECVPSAVVASPYIPCT